MAGHTLELFLFLLHRMDVALGKYLAFSIRTHNLSKSLARDHPSFPSIAEFITFKFLIPKPPQDFGLQAICQATRVQNFFSFFFLVHINFRICCSTSLHNSIGILLADIKYIGMADRTCFTRVTLPVWERSLAFQPSRRHFILLVMASKSFLCDQFGNNLCPKYLASR